MLFSLCITQRGSAGLHIYELEYASPRHRNCHVAHDVAAPVVLNARFRANVRVDSIRVKRVLCETPSVTSWQRSWPKCLMQLLPDTLQRNGVSASSRAFHGKLVRFVTVVCLSR